MRTKLSLLIGVLLLIGNAANATCPYTNTFVSGTTALASAVNTNFSDISNCFLQLTGGIIGGTTKETVQVTSGGTTIGNTNLQLQKFNSGPAFLVSTFSTNTTFGSDLILARGVSGTDQNYSAVQTNTNVGTMRFAVADGSKFMQGAYINGRTEANTSANAATVALTFGTSNGGYPVETMRLSGAGNLGVGQTSPSYLLHVGSSSASGIVAELQNSSGACIHTPGSSSETVSCSSDLRLKRNIVDAGDQLALLDGMHIRDFTVRATGERRTGVIAQELLKTHPEMVHVGPDGYYKVDEPNPWVLVKAIQEQQAQISDLRAMIDQLKVANGILQHRLNEATAAGPLGQRAER